MSAEPHPTLYIQFLNRENNDKNDTFPLGKQICNEGYGGRYTITYLIELHFDSPLRKFKGFVFLPIH